MCVYFVFAFAQWPLSYVTVLKLRYVNVYCLFSNLSIQYSDFAIPMDLHKKDVNCFYYVLSVHIKK